MEQTRCNDAERCYRDPNDCGEILQESSIKTWILGHLDEGPQGDVSSPDNPFVFADADGKGPTFEHCGHHQHAQADRGRHDRLGHENVTDALIEGYRPPKKKTNKATTKDQK